MTQGHEPHGKGGREKLLIKACGISYSYHRTSSVFPQWLPPTIQQPITPSGKEAHREGGDEVEPGVKFTREGLVLKANAAQFGHFAGGGRSGRGLQISLLSVT